MGASSKLTFDVLTKVRSDSDLLRWSTAAPAAACSIALLPRQCPVCQDHTIISHGQRLRQAHDDRHEHIWVRRGVCHPCGKTFTVLPDGLAPSGHFSLRCRQQACELMAAGNSVEQAPHCKDPSRLP